ncbi:MAG: LexA family transcriptional regulator [Gluconobacter cerinus]|uniref:S24 family peptidase n=1 Tax=Gluconobacter cerinus TaxID=38307 RepID=UPI0039E9DA02
MCAKMHNMDEAQETAIQFVKAAMQATGLDASNLARQAKIAPSTLTRLLNGKAKNALSARTMLKISQISKIPTAILQPEEKKKLSPLFGYVGAGDKVYPFDGEDPVDWVESPIWEDRDTCALLVKGDSMFPAYWEGDIVFFEKEKPYCPSDILFDECIVKLRSGELYLKRVQPGRSSDRFTLISYNASPIMDADIEWASPVTFVDRRQRRPRK